MTTSMQSILSDVKRSAAAEQVVASVSEQGIETIRVLFADQHGILRGKTIVVEDIKAALDSGMRITSTLLLKDTSHTTVFPVWGDDAGFGKGKMIGASDLIMLPDPETFRVLPWTSDSASILCDLFSQEGEAIPLSSRHILKAAVNRLTEIDMAFICGLEVEFYVYRLEEHRLAHTDTGKPGSPPETSVLSQGYQYLTDQHFDQLVPVMELIRRNARAMALPIRTMESEFGPSQFEVTFQPMPALEAADNMCLFRNMVKQVCKREGYHATFMCRPNLENAMGNGWHLHQSVIGASGENLFTPASGQTLSETASSWIAGLLEHAMASCLLTTPTVNGYKRYQPFALAPDRVQWGEDNRGAMIRALCRPDDPASRVENRVGEPAANPYLYIASQILSGLDGVKKGATAPQPTETPYANEMQKLPESLITAVDRFSESKLYRQTLGDEFVDYLVAIKRAEWKRFMQTVSDWEHREYFSLF
ncbi:MAG: glutamine synthetase family protein [Granulosicoccus sp.]|nr:glutamine synthetase family protein [Granulosicoccus sp.]